MYGYSTTINAFVVAFLRPFLLTPGFPVSPVASCSYSHEQPEDDADDHDHEFDTDWVIANHLNQATFCFGFDEPWPRFENARRRARS